LYGPTNTPGSIKAATSAAFTSSFLTLTTKASCDRQPVGAVGDDGYLDVTDLVAIDSGGLLARVAQQQTLRR
jgi:hypothetical protein